MIISDTELLEMDDIQCMTTPISTLKLNKTVYRGSSLTPGILANANVAIKEAIGLVSAGSQRPLQWFTFHRHLQPRAARVLLAQTSCKLLSRQKNIPAQTRQAHRSAERTANN